MKRLALIAALSTVALPAMAFNNSLGTGPGVVTGPPVFSSAPPGGMYLSCMNNIQAQLPGMTDPELRKSFLDHAAEACVAAEARKH